MRLIMNEEMKTKICLLYELLDQLDTFYETHFAYDIPIQGDKLLQIAKQNYEALELAYELREEVTK